MNRYKVTDKTGASIEYIAPAPLDWTALGLGLGARPEIGPDGQPTGNTLPAEYTVEVTDITYETDLAACIASRIAEYPTAGDYLNAVFDGSPSLDDLKAKRLAIKAKYPKPVKPGGA
jgi:hypothetical protein